MLGAIGENLYKQMHADLKSGSVLVNDKSYETYMTYFLVSFAIFSAYFFGSHTVLSMTCTDFYTSWQEQSQIRIRAMSMSNVHHIIVLVICLYNLIYACHDSSNYPVQHEKQYFRWIHTDQCFLQPYEGFGILLSITLGYLVMDLSALLLCYKERTSVQK